MNIRKYKKQLKLRGLFHSVDWKISELMKKHRLKSGDRFSIKGICGTFHFTKIIRNWHLYEEESGHYDMYLIQLARKELLIDENY